MTGTRNARAFLELSRRRISARLNLPPPAVCRSDPYRWRLSPVLESRACRPASSLAAHRNHRRAPTAGFRGRIRERFNEGRARQNPAHGLALHADSAAVNDPERMESLAARLQQILLDYAFDVPRSNRVQIEYVSYRNADRASGKSSIKRKSPTSKPAGPSIF